MQIKNAEKISSVGYKYNEDISNIVSNAAWVLDGATGLGCENYASSESDAKWYVEMWDQYLLQNITNTHKNLKDIIFEGLDYIEKEYNSTTNYKKIEDINKPSAGIVLVRWNKYKLEYFILGDCQLWVNSINGVRVIADYRLQNLDNKVINVMSKYIEQGYSFNEARNSIQDLLIENRLKSNKKDGYWSLSFSKAAVSNSLNDTIIFNDETKAVELLLSTDGFYAIVDKYEKMKETEVFHYIKQQGLIALLNCIRDIENKDPDAKQYVRFKKSDDASAVYLSFI